MYVVTQFSVEYQDVCVLPQSFSTIDDAKKAVEEVRQEQVPGIYPAKWEDNFCSLHDYAIEEDADDVFFIIHKVGSTLQGKADKLSKTINEFIDGCEYDENRQEYSFDQSEHEWGCFIFGKMQMLMDIDSDLKWNDEYMRFDIVDMSLFHGD